MKKYTFTVDNKNTRNNNIPSTNYSEILSDIIRSNIKKSNPYLFGGIIDRDYKPEIAIIPSTKRTIDIDITIPRTKKIATGSYKSPFSYAEIAKAIKFLASYDDGKDDYDFKLPDGTPVKRFADEIQIGFDLIPLNNFTEALYEALSDKAKKSIIDIYISINK